MACKKCGDIDQNDAFCSKCGSEIDHSITVCASCNEEVLNSSFCHLCGSRLVTVADDFVRACASCGAQANDGNFCRTCGVPQGTLTRVTTSQGGQAGHCPACGATKLAAALKTDKWVVCLACFSEHNRVKMVDRACPSCRGSEVYENLGDAGSVCRYCIESKHPGA